MVQEYYSSDCLCDLDDDGGIICTDCDLPEAQYQYQDWDVSLPKPTIALLRFNAIKKRKSGATSKKIS